MILSGGNGASVLLGTLTWRVEMEAVHCEIHGDEDGRIWNIMEEVGSYASIAEGRSFSLARVKVALLERDLCYEDVSLGDYSLDIEFNMDTGRNVGTARPLHPYAIMDDDLGGRIHASIELALRKPLEKLAEELHTTTDPADAVGVLKEAEAAGVLGFFPTTSVLAALQAVDLSAATTADREFLRRARLEVAQRLQRYDIVAAEAGALLAESPAAFSTQEKAKLETAIAIGLAKRGRTEAALAIWRRLIGADTPLDAAGRAWVWRNISMTLPLSDPEAMEAARQSADAFLQAGNKLQAGTSLLRMADCLMTEAPDRALDALDQMFALVEQEGITNLELRAGVHHARGNRLLMLRNASLALDDAMRAIALRRGLLGAESQLISSLNLAAAALMVLGRNDEAKTYSDEADALTSQKGVSHFELANQVMSLFETFDRNLADRIEQTARASGSWELVSGVVVARGTRDPSLTQEARLGVLEGLLMELRGIGAPDDMSEPARQAVAGLLTEMGKPERAVGWWRDLARDRPWDRGIMSNLLNAYMALEDWAEAEKLLRAQIALVGERPGFLFFLGKVLYSAGRMSEALTNLHKANGLSQEGSDLKRNILELREKALDAGGTILADELPAPPKDVSRAELEAALDEFATHIATNLRMSFWRKKAGKREWVESPERLSKDQLYTFLQAKLSGRIRIFTEIVAGAGRLDLYLQFSGGLTVIIELKMCGGRYPSSYAAAGEDQILHYLENRDTRLGYLIVFDARIGKFGESVLVPRNADNYTVYEKFVDVRPEWPRPSKAEAAGAK